MGMNEHSDEFPSSGFNKKQKKNIKKIKELS